MVEAQLGDRISSHLKLYQSAIMISMLHD